VYIERNVKILTRYAISCDEDACNYNKEEEDIKNEVIELDSEEINYKCLRYKDITLVLFPGGSAIYKRI
jgi:hypothetical protein